MSKKNPFSFIQQKIQELNTALFFPETGALLKIPNYLVNTVQVDEDGNIWFTIRKPAEYIDPLDTIFHCKLDFFKKGVSHYVKVKGKATIFSKLEEISCPKKMRDITRCMKSDQMAAVKVEIEQADYFQTPAAEMKPASNEKKAFISRLFPSRENLSYSYKPAFAFS